MIISKPHLLTRLDIWYPKYNGESGWEVWISRTKAHHSSGIILINFTRANHLRGQRFCVRRDDVIRSPLGSNGKIPVYRVPFDKLEGYDTPQEVYELANQVFEE